MEPKSLGKFSAFAGLFLGMCNSGINLEFYMQQRELHSYLNRHGGYDRICERMNESRKQRNEIDLKLEDKAGVTNEYVINYKVDPELIRGVYAIDDYQNIRDAANGYTLFFCLVGLLGLGFIYYEEKNNY